MIKIEKVNIFDLDCESIVNPVNTVGVMGGGLAKLFKEKYSNDMLQSYKRFCIKNYEKFGILHVYNEMHKPIVINFPTKTHFNKPSEYLYIVEGLKTLRNFIKEYDIKSIAIPLLGAGLGGLERRKVIKLIKLGLNDINNCEIIICDY